MSWRTTENDTEGENKSAGSDFFKTGIQILKATVPILIVANARHILQPRDGGPAFPLSVLTNQDTAFEVSITRQGIPLFFYVDRLPLDLSKALWDGSPSHFLQQSYQVSWPLIPRCTEQPRAPASLSHVFHWGTKWYSMLPIASLSVSFFFALCLPSLRVLLTDSKGAAKLHGYLDAGDGQEEILRLAWPAAWQTPDFTLAI